MTRHYNAIVSSAEDQVASWEAFAARLPMRPKMR